MVTLKEVEEATKNFAESLYYTYFLWYYATPTAEMLSSPFRHEYLQDMDTLGHEFEDKLKGITSFDLATPKGRDVMKDYAVKFWQLWKGYRNKITEWKMERAKKKLTEVV